MVATRPIKKFKDKCPTCQFKTFDKIRNVGAYSILKCRRCGTTITLHPSNWYDILEGPDRDYNTHPWWKFWR